MILEIGNALWRLRFRRSAIETIERLKMEPDITIISITDELIDDAFELFKNRADKEWGLIDCISFVVMGQRKIEVALTADEHFIQAGFRALLREN